MNQCADFCAFCVQPCPTCGETMMRVTQTTMWCRKCLWTVQVQCRRTG